MNIVGPSSEGRMISVVFTLRDGRVRPISARNASRKERKLYEEVSKTLKKL
ncbi:MAG: BrnT family toxin [Pseudobdellovibrionaceae bacterium]